MAAVSNSSTELVARLSYMFRSLTSAERDAFLCENGLCPVSATAAPAIPRQHSSNTLVVSPAKLGGASGSCRLRVAEAKRLAEDDNSISQRVLGAPLLNVSGVRFTDTEVRALFDSLDASRNGWLTKDEFLHWYDQLETFGTPGKRKWVLEKLTQMNTTAADKIVFEEFAVLVGHLALQ